MERITIKHLDAICSQLNEATGSPLTPYTRGDDGRMRANVGNYHVSQAYGGFCIHRTENESGGVSTPLSYGHIPARELFGLARDYLDGISARA